jgi:hypothetical protein
MRNPPEREMMVAVGNVKRILWRCDRTRDWNL